MRLMPLLAALLPLLPLPALAAAPASSETLRVDRYNDDGQPGSLRWAIETSNQNPGRYRIDIAPVGKPPYVIRPTRPLPEIKGPVRITGLSWAQDGQYIAIDGSGYIKDQGVHTCPGALPGQYGTNVRTTTHPGLVLRDTQGVHLSGLEVRNFCIGILVNRASGNVIEDNRIVANKGGAGIMLTGDDGAGNPTATTTVNNKVLRNQLVDNGDGLELTRGAAFNLVADNLFRSTPANPEPSQGIEILLGNDNSVVRNRFENYSDGLQINWGNRNYLGANTFTGNSNGVSVTGDGNILDGNLIHGNRIGVALRPEPNVTATRLTANRIWGNSQDIRRCEAGGSCVPDQRTGAIVFGVPAQAHALYVGSRGIGADLAKKDQAIICDGNGQPKPCQPLPNHNQPAPRLTALQGEQLQGEVSGPASSLLRVEVFGNAEANGTEAQQYLGQVLVSSDKDGKATFAQTLENAAELRSFTATVTTAEGATSELSRPLSR
ncbi:3-dehydroshikimate dehydratase [Pseudomonas sp. SWI6]|uniref:mannuronan 5-epimerase n=1 Tax=Pseudomonas taiwanensis TaxID=470150 RepID=A0ABR6VBL8_9PSED|nr:MULTISPECIES: NosD domain-containing protein [Pseudomonas]AGZ36421.1 parallel beta-helix repeat-containing protein [Pseudomonas sp. VLB120]AVD82147.1 3-dehydroshikimate dehydratase [Pseudomonas sp. SWI6]MBC3477876.1 right-handed parallel beta-helix repeat-containing protein [Pseudomonas taiwanensis]MBC3492548.1 right-handed parallel beta-helix repeat-containing protein [Pseudomonas taiwanensis]MDT8924558.1 NosD domain-containing protein [Pseudomonas taiwanensis]